MTNNLEKIQRDVAALSRDDLEHFRRWFLDFDTEVWYGSVADEALLDEDFHVGELPGSDSPD